MFSCTCFIDWQLFLRNHIHWYRFLTEVMVGCRTEKRILFENLCRDLVYIVLDCSLPHIHHVAFLLFAISSGCFPAAAQLYTWTSAVYIS